MLSPLLRFHHVLTYIHLASSSAVAAIAILVAGVSIVAFIVLVPVVAAIIDAAENAFITFESGLPPVF